MREKVLVFLAFGKEAVAVLADNTALAHLRNLCAGRVEAGFQLLARLGGAEVEDNRLFIRRKIRHKRRALVVDYVDIFIGKREGCIGIEQRRLAHKSVSCIALGKPCEQLYMPRKALLCLGGE